MALVSTAAAPYELPGPSSYNHPSSPVRALPPLPIPAVRRLDASQRSISSGAGGGAHLQGPPPLSTLSAVSRSPSAPPAEPRARTTSNQLPSPPSAAAARAPTLPPQPSPSLGRPLPAPLASSHGHSASIGSLSRLAPAHLIPSAPLPSPSPPISAHHYSPTSPPRFSPQGGQAYPPGQNPFLQYPAFGQGYAPQYHPQQNGYGGYELPQGYEPTPAQQARMFHAHQVQIQQAQAWHFEMMRAKGANPEYNTPQHSPNDGPRRRATSGPSPPPTTPPSSAYDLSRSLNGLPSFPPGAMPPLPANGYPLTPPPENQQQREREASYHPYRKNTAPASMGGAQGRSPVAEGRTASPRPTIVQGARRGHHEGKGSVDSANSGGGQAGSARSSPRPAPPLLDTRAPSAPPPSSELMAQPVVPWTESPSSSPVLPPLSLPTDSLADSTFTGSREQDGEHEVLASPIAFAPPALPRLLLERERKDSTDSAGSREATVGSRADTPVQGSSGSSSVAESPVAGRSPLSLETAPSPVGAAAEDREEDVTERPDTPRASAPFHQHQRAASGMGDQEPESGDDSDDTIPVAAAGVMTGVADPIVNPNAPFHGSAVPVYGSAATPQEQKKGMGMKLRKAFSMNSLSLNDTDLNGKGPKALNVARQQQQHLRRPSTSSSENSSTPRTPPSTHYSSPSIASTSTSTLNDTAKPRPRRFGGMLNPKMNSSTDNISISSTVSSASVMIRKLGQMGKLARRNSLMSLTNVFKGKEGEDGDESKAGKKGKKDKKDKKGSLASASVSHATVEFDSGTAPVNGMSPAAALAKQQQQMYAEQEAAALAQQQLLASQQARAAVVPNRGGVVGDHSRTTSSVSEASIRASGFGRAKTTDDADVSVGGAKNKMLEKEKERLKSRKARKWGFGSLSSSSAGRPGENEVAPAAAIESPPESATPRQETFEYTPQQYDDNTPRQSLEILTPAPPQLGPIAGIGTGIGNAELSTGTPYAAYGGSYSNEDESDSPAQSAGDEEYYVSHAEGVLVHTHRRGVRPARGILKGAGSYNQEDFAAPRPHFSRSRANSHDYPQHQQGHTPVSGAALVGAIPSEAQVDGVSHSHTVSREMSFADSGSVPAPHHSGSSAVYGNPAMNASEPVLQTFMASHQMRSNSAPGATGRKISFAPNLSVHTTWPAEVYDRRAEPAACNRLTAAFAQRIKEELNAFKMEEMDVHPMSRQLTHFFV